MGPWNNKNIGPAKGSRWSKSAEIFFGLKTPKICPKILFRFRCRIERLIWFIVYIKNIFCSNDQFPPHPQMQCVQILQFRSKVALLDPPLRFSFCKLREARKPKKWRFFTSLNFYVIKFKYFFDSEKQKKNQKVIQNAIFFDSLGWRFFLRIFKIFGAFGGRKIWTHCWQMGSTFFVEGVNNYFSCVHG